MLNVFRQNANNWLMVVVLGAITFVFVFTFGSWGGGNLSGDMPVAATVNGEVIPMSLFRVQYAQTFRMQTMYRQGYTADQARAEGLDQQVLDRLIKTELLAQAAASRGLVVTDDEIAETVQKRFFGDDKPFDLEEYKRIVNSVYNTSESRFEESLRRELLAVRLEDILGDSLHVSEKELVDSYNQKNDRADVEFLKIDPVFWKARAKAPTDAELAAFKTDNKAEIEKFYTEHINRYREGKKVEARHILIKVADDAADADKNAARARIDAALARVKGGEDFAKVATELSEDSSAKDGGSLGKFGEGQMVKPFEDAAFALKKGEISEVVQSKFGFHVIKVDEVYPATKKELAEVDGDIAKTMFVERQQKAEAKKLAEAALAELKAGKTMAELTDASIVKPSAEGSAPPEGTDPFAPKVDATGFFARSVRVVPRIGLAPDVVAAAFDKLSIEQPLHDGVFEVNGRFFVVRLKGRERPDPAKFAAEREGLEQQAVSGRKSQTVDAFTEGLRAKARIEKNPKLLTSAG
jgi:peptidyl-prolyl cis-trans isomerase D